MQLIRSVTLGAQVLLFCLPLIHTVPIQDSTHQHYLNDGPSEQQKHSPFTRKHRDWDDHKIDSVGKGLHPLPFRNGYGADMPGPRNPAREQQNPDVIRPPTTDHGTLPSFRWSFADSHIRIEVRYLRFIKMRTFLYLINYICNVPWLVSDMACRVFDRYIFFLSSIDFGTS